MDELNEYKALVKERLDRLTPILAKTAIGDFSQDVAIPLADDEFTELYVGVQMMLEVIREKIGELNTVNATLGQRVEESTALLKSIGDGVIAINEQGTVIFANDHASSMLNLTSEAIINKLWQDILVMADESGKVLPVEERPLSRAIHEKIMVSTSDLLLVRRDGSTLPVAATATPVVIDGKIAGAIDVFRNITKEKEIERMKTEFISLSAHQLRTPLGTMRWNIEMLNHRALSYMPEKDQQKLGIIYESILRMITLVNELLNVSRIDEGKAQNLPVRTKLVPLVNDIIKESAENAAARRVTIEITNDTDTSVEAIVDAERFREVLANLISNAIKYNVNDGKVIISVIRQGKQALIKVSDTGIGIPKRDQVWIFSKFFRATNATLSKAEGTGLGLYMVKYYIYKWDGRIWFESEENKGTTFFIELPLG